MDEKLLLVRGLFTLIYFIIWVFIVKKQAKNLWYSFTGEDHILQVSEFVVLAGMIAYITIIPADAFWNIEASQKVWYGINIIVLGALGASTYLKNKSKKEGE